MPCLAPRIPPSSLFVWLLAFLALAGCGEEEAALQVGPVGFSTSDLLGLSEAQQWQLVLLTQVGLAVSSGQEKAIGELPLQTQRTTRVGERLREEILLGAAGVTESELERRYLENPDQELLVRHLVILSERWRSEAERAEARRRTESARDRILRGEAFESVVAEVSEEPGAARREGLLQPGRRGTWVREFWDAAQALEPGAISPVVETEYGFHVLRLEERRLLPFVDARDRVVSEVARRLGGGEAWERWSELRRRAIEVDSAVVLTFDPGNLSLDRGEEEGAILARWPALAGGPEPDFGTVPRDPSSPPGSLTAVEATRILRGLPRPEWESFRNGSAPERLKRIQELALLHLQSETARELGLEPPSEVTASLERDWERKLAQWALILGFRPGLSPTALHEAALRALRATGQNARIARTEVLEWGSAFEVWNPRLSTEDR